MYLAETERLRSVLFPLLFFDRKERGDGAQSNAGLGQTSVCSTVFLKTSLGAGIFHSPVCKSQLYRICMTMESKNRQST